MVSSSSSARRRLRARRIAIRFAQAQSLVVRGEIQCRSDIPLVPPGAFFGVPVQSAPALYDPILPRQLMPSQLGVESGHYNCPPRRILKPVQCCFDTLCTPLILHQAHQLVDPVPSTPLVDDSDYDNRLSGFVDLAPDAVSYSAVISACEDEAHQKESATVQPSALANVCKSRSTPDTTSYSVCSAISASEKAEQREPLDECKLLGTPNIVRYNAACSTCVDRMNMAVAETFGTSIECHYCYGTSIFAYDCDDDRDEHVCEWCIDFLCNPCPFPTGFPTPDHPPSYSYLLAPFPDSSALVIWGTQARDFFLDERAVFFSRACAIECTVWSIKILAVLIDICIRHWSVLLFVAAPT